MTPLPLETQPIVRTVLGDVAPDALGWVDYHEHLFQVSPLLPGDELDDERLSASEASSLRSAGVASMVEATPTGLGRDVEAVARISAASGLIVIHTTGAHHSGHYPAVHPLRSATEEELTRRFTRDVSIGFDVGSDLEGDHSADDSRPARAPDGTPVRAGIVKTGLRYWSIGTFERAVLGASAATHRATGVPVMVHLDHGSASHEVLDLLDQAGVRSDRVVLAHMDRNLDPGLHASLIERGAYLGYDGMGRHREAPDSSILDCLVRTVDSAGVSRIVLGGDVARATRYRAYGGLPGLDYLPRRFAPRVVAAIGRESADAIFIENPARLLAFTPC